MARHEENKSGATSSAIDYNQSIEGTKWTEGLSTNWPAALL
jgi:hypothetical protein